MRILVAPDSFKGSLTAVAFCQIAREVIEAHWPHLSVLTRPLSDGGEGFVDALVDGGVAQRCSSVALDPLGRPLQADYAWQPQTATAYIEMAQASGLPLLAPTERDPWCASSYGCGQVIAQAIERGAQNIVLGLGGSATNDGGLGALQALGVELLDKQDRPIERGGKGLAQVAKISKVPEHLLTLTWQLACDVTNPLLGTEGATAVYGAQKGVNAQLYPQLEQGMSNWAQVLQAYASDKVADWPGSGAAGGMAAGMMGVFNAKVRPGFDVLADATRLEDCFSQGLDLVITGEGRMDAQTSRGKLPLRVAQLAKRYHVPVLGLCGQLDICASRQDDFTALFSLVNGVQDEASALARTEQNLRDSLYSAINLLRHQP